MAPQEMNFAFMAEETQDANMADADAETKKLEDDVADANKGDGMLGDAKSIDDLGKQANDVSADTQAGLVQADDKTSADGWNDFTSDLVAGDEGDKRAMEDKFFKKTKVNCRGRIHNFCDGMEICADLMLTDALLNKATRADVLEGRQKLLFSLWKFRDTADCEDDFDQDEFHSEMRVLAVIQRKLMSLDIKVDTMADGGESSSDTEGDGEKDNLQKLKFARQCLRYAMGKGSIPAA